MVVQDIKRKELLTGLKMKYMHPLSNYYAGSWKQMKTQNETFGTFQRAIETLWPVTF